MNRAKLFAALRRRDSGVFGTSLSQAQVEGTEAILASCIRNGVTSIHHIANVLAQVYHETGGYMLPIKETVYVGHKNKNPSDATVIARLDNAYAKGQLTWVSKPYWRDGWFGRGPIQLTHRRNYARMSDRLGVDLLGNPNLALDHDVGADIAVVGMKEGMFTGKKLSDFNFPAALDANPDDHPRRIVNGRDGTDDKITGYHIAFANALREAGYVARETPTSKREPSPSVPLPGKAEMPSAGKGGRNAGIAAVVAIVGGALAMFWQWLAMLPCDVPIIQHICGA